MVMRVKKEKPLPFRRNFVIGIALVFFAKFLSAQLGIDWILYVGVILGSGLCIIDVFKALKRMD